MFRKSDFSGEITAKFFVYRMDVRSELTTDDRLNKNISTNYWITSKTLYAVWPMVKRKKIAKVFALSQCFIELKVSVPTSLSHSISKKQKKKKRNLCKLMKIYLSAHENHLMFPAVNIYSKTGERDKGSFLPKNSLKFCIFTFSTIFIAHTKG